MSLVPAVDRAIQILKAFQSGDEAVGVSELSRRLDLNKSTVYDILNTLAFHGLLTRNEQTKKYRPGPAFYQLGSIVGMRLDLATMAQPLLAELATTTSQTVILGTYTLDDHILIGAVAKPAHDLQISVAVGQRLHHSAGAPGKIFHAAMAPGALMSLLARDPLRPSTPRTITDPARYQMGLEAVREAGYATDDEEYLTGVRAVAAPVCDWSGAVVAALYVVGFRSRLTPDQMEALTRLVPAVARDLSLELGAPPRALWPHDLDMEEKT